MFVLKKIVVLYVIKFKFNYDVVLINIFKLLIICVDNLE